MKVQPPKTVEEMRSPQLEYYYRNKSKIIRKQRAWRETKRQQQEYELYKRLHEKYGSE